MDTSSLYLSLNFLRLSRKASVRMLSGWLDDLVKKWVGLARLAIISINNLWINLWPYWREIWAGRNLKKAFKSLVSGDSYLD